MIDRLRAERIIQTVEAKAEIPPGTILAQCRLAEQVRARWIATVLCREFVPTLNLIQLGRVLQRDHSTIIHILKNFPKRYGDSDPLYLKVKDDFITRRRLTQVGRLVASATPDGRMRLGQQLSWRE
jgi:chromosomal replication initiation ATPase DnaA